MQSPLHFSCIIPFFNEGERILSMLRIIAEIPLLSQVICVDDGSRDNTSQEIQQKWPSVDLIVLPKNVGKSSAIKHGLKAVKFDHILLMDADLRFINITELLNAIETVENQQFIDMLILRRVKAPWYFKIDRRDVLFSGERILRKNDLDDVLKNDILRYQLEIAINQHMIKNKKVVRWITWSASNTHKARKWGLVYGFKREIMMFWDMIIFGGIIEYLRQIIIFARKEA